MKNLLLIIGSVTYALKAQNILSKENINSYLQKTPPEKNDCGCSYSLKVRSRDGERAIAVLDSSGVKVKDTVELNGI